MATQKSYRLYGHFFLRNSGPELWSLQVSIQKHKRAKTVGFRTCR